MKSFARYAVAAIVCVAACGHGGMPAAAPPVARSLRLVQHVEVLDTLVREPMLVEHPSGALFVSGYNRVRPRLWKSVDRGATWSSVDVGTAEQGAIGNSDVDLAVAADGTLYFVSLLFDGRSGEGVQIAVGVSEDLGRTWRWKTVSRARYDDRPWLGVAPNGAVHLIWNDDRGVLHVISRDRGATWSQPMRVNDRGGSSHFAVGPRGELAIRIAPGATSGAHCDKGTDLIALSTDDGATWRKFAAPGVETRAPGCFESKNEILRWVDPIAFDGAGALYALWTDSLGAALSRAPRGAETWTTWRGAMTRYAPEPYPYYPFLASRGDTVLTGTWILKSARELRARLAYVLARPNVPPIVWSVLMPVIESQRDGNPETAGEYFATKPLRDGSVAVVTPIQNDGAKRYGFSWWRYELR